MTSANFDQQPSNWHTLGGVVSFRVDNLEDALCRTLFNCIFANFKMGPDVTIKVVDWLKQLSEYKDIQWDMSYQAAREQKVWDSLVNKNTGSKQFVDPFILALTGMQLKEEFEQNGQINPTLIKLFFLLGGFKDEGPNFTRLPDLSGLRTVPKGPPLSMLKDRFSL